MIILKYKKQKAFTLAEVLIALVIIGVISAITMMIIVPSIREAQTVSRVKHAYSVFSQAFLKAEMEDGPAELWALDAEDSQSGAKELHRIFGKQIVKAMDCDTDKGCFYDGDYKAMNGKTLWAWNPRLHQRYARGVLANGIAFAFWSGGEGCNASGQDDNSEEGIYSRVCGAIHIDINGAAKPNRAGYDFFTLDITPDGLYPTGLKGFKSKYGDKCKFGDNSNTNGNTCIGWIIAKGNMDYLKRDITNEL